MTQQECGNYITFLLLQDVGSNLHMILVLNKIQQTCYWSAQAYGYALLTAQSERASLCRFVAQLCLLMEKKKKGLATGRRSRLTVRFFMY